MSAGVSDQRMKGQGNQAPNVSKDHVESGEDFESWRHQPGNHGQYIPNSTTSDPYNAAGGQFQYPQFGVGDGTWSSGNENLAILGGYAGHDNYGVDGMFGPSFGQPSEYNYFPGNGDFNTWSSNKSKKGLPYDDYYREQGVYPPIQDGIKNVEQGVQNLVLENNSSLQQSQEKDVSHNTNSSSNTNNTNTSKQDYPKESIPKKMTWATIASQPAKPQVRTSASTSTIKKKGPGMPPPPMIPGKHNMDIGTWDSSSKNPPPSMLVPPPVPPRVMTSAPPPTIPPPINNVKQNAQSGAAPFPTKNLHQSSQNSGQQQPPSQQQLLQQSGNGVSMNIRPPWANTDVNNQQTHPNAVHQQQRPNVIHMQGPPPSIMPSGFQNPPPQLLQHNVMLHTAQQNQKHPQQSRGLQSPVSNCSSSGSHPVLEKLRDKNNYNPEELDLERAHVARFFVIKSYSEDDIHRSIKYEIWCSTEHGNKRLDQAYHEREKANGLIYLFFSVNGSGHFCGIAQMISAVDYNSNSTVWSQNKWKGVFGVKWIYVKDVPNSQLRHIQLENNENKSVTHSRDTQEVPNAKGQSVMRVIHDFKHTTSIFDDFTHYEKRQEEEDSRKTVDIPLNNKSMSGSNEKPYQHHYNNISKMHHSNYEKDNHYNSGGGSMNANDKHGSANYGGKNYGYDTRNQYNNHGGRPSGGGGGYYNYENRRDDRSGGGGSSYDRNNSNKEHNEGGNSGYYSRDSDFHYNRGNRGNINTNSDRPDYRDQRRDDRGYNRDRDNHHENTYGNRGDSRGGNRDGYRDRGDHHNNNRGGRGGGTRGGFRN